MDVFFDGSLRDGRIRTCVVIAGRKPVVKRWPNPRRLTSGHAEWLAAKEAAKLVAKRATTDVVFKGDYENIARHFDQSDPKPCQVGDNKKLAADIADILTTMRAAGKGSAWLHVDRGLNLAGIHLDDTWTPTAS